MNIKATLGAAFIIFLFSTSPVVFIYIGYDAV